MAQNGLKRVVYAALFANLLIAVTKFAAAAFTGSSAMLSEAVHSLADTGNQVLLLYGARRAAKPPDERHPFGYGRELYFWSFVVAIVMFGVGAGVAFYEGLHRILNPHPSENVYLSYAVLIAALLFETASFVVAIREFRHEKGSLGYFQAAHVSKDPQIFVVLFEDAAALLGLAIALAATVLSEVLAMPVIDGVGSLAIALLLALVAGFLAAETKSLLIGEATDAQTLRDIKQIITVHPAVTRLNRLWSTHLGPGEVLIAASIDFEDSLRGDQIEAATAELEREIKRRHPEVRHFFVEVKEIAERERQPATA